MKRLPSNWRSRIELVRLNEEKHCFPADHLYYVYRWCKGKTPRGWSRQFGFMIVDPNGYVEDVDLDKEFRGRKLGIAMYERALQDKGILRTRYHRASQEARQCWISLIRRHQHQTDFWAHGGLLEVRGP